VADTALSLPVRVPARTPSLRVTLTSPLGRVGTDTTFAVRPGPNWLRLDLRAVPPGLYRYRVAGPRDARTGTLVVARPARSKPGPVGMK
jgi:hypothetical protein